MSVRDINGQAQGPAPTAFDSSGYLTTPSLGAGFLYFVREKHPLTDGDHIDILEEEHLL